MVIAGAACLRSGPDGRMDPARIAEVKKRCGIRRAEGENSFQNLSCLFGIGRRFIIRIRRVGKNPDKTVSAIIVFRKTLDNFNGNIQIQEEIPDFTPEDSQFRGLQHSGKISVRMLRMEVPRIQNQTEKHVRRTFNPEFQ